MAKRGPKPKTLEQKRREGGRLRTPTGHTRKIPAAPIVVAGTGSVSPTQDLSVGERAAWDRLLPIIQASGIALGPAFADQLTQLAQVVAELEELSIVLRDEGLFTVTPNGFRQPHWASGRRDKARRQLRDLSELFGLDPVNQTRLAGAGLVVGVMADPNDAPARPSRLKRVK